MMAMPPPPDLAAEALRVREQLRTAEALERAGQYAQGLPLAGFIASEARRLAYAPVQAEALLRLVVSLCWILPATLPDGFQPYLYSPGYYMPLVTGMAFNGGAASYQSLTAGESAHVTLNYMVTDGTAQVATSYDVTVTGLNDAPIIVAPVALGFAKDALHLMEATS